MNGGYGHDTSDEIFSDAAEYKLVDDLYYEIEGKHTSESTNVTDDMIGGNASAEGTDEVADETTTNSGISFVLANRLMKTEYKKKEFVAYIKGYMKKVKLRLQKDNPERVDKFVNGAQAKVKTIIENFSEWDTYTGESGNQDGIVVLVNYREDGITAYGIIWKDGVYEEKY